MNFDPRLIDGPNTLPDMLVVAQELENRDPTLTPDDINTQMDDAANRIADGNDQSGTSVPMTAANIAALVGVDAPTPENTAEAKAAIAAFIQGGTPVAEHSLGPGFAAYAQANNLKPLTDEFYVAGDQASFAMTDGGLLVYTKDDNQVRLLPPKA